MWAYIKSLKSPKFYNYLVKICPKGYISLTDFDFFLQNSARAFMPNFTDVTFKMAYSPKTAKIGIFGINFPEKGTSP